MKPYDTPPWSLWVSSIGPQKTRRLEDTSFRKTPWSSLTCTPHIMTKPFGETLKTSGLRGSWTSLEHLFGTKISWHFPWASESVWANPWRGMSTSCFLLICSKPFMSELRERLIWNRMWGWLWLPNRIITFWSKGMFKRYFIPVLLVPSVFPLL